MTQAEVRGQQQLGRGRRGFPFWELWGWLHHGTTFHHGDTEPRRESSGKKRL